MTTRIIRMALCSALAVAGCTGAKGDAGATGPGGTDGTNGTNGTDGSNGMTGSNGNDVIISDSAKHGLDISPVTVNTTGMTAAQIEAVGQGSYLVNAVAGCAHCHGHPTDTAGFLAGKGKAYNLTPDATTGLQLTADQFVDALRTGTAYTCTAGSCVTSSNATIGAVGDQTLSPGMPWLYFRWGSDSDLRAIYAYLRAIPAISNTITPLSHSANPTRVAFTGKFEDIASKPALPAEFDASSKPIPDPDYVRRGLAMNVFPAVLPPDDPTAASRFARGAYLVNGIGKCGNCHTNPERDSTTRQVQTTKYLTGGHLYVSGSTPLPVAANVGDTFRALSADLAGSTGGFFANETFVTFEGLIQTGMHVEDPTPAPVADPMPWEHFRNMTLEDLQAIFTYVNAIAGDAAITSKTIADASLYCAADGDCDAGETCDTGTTSPTYHQCIGRACDHTASDGTTGVNTACRACQKCVASGANVDTCGGIDSTALVSNTDCAVN